MSSVRLAEAFTEQYMIPLKEVRAVDSKRDIERTNSLDSKSISTYERYHRVVNMVLKFKSSMGRIKTILQFEIGKDSAKRGITSLDIGILNNGTQTTIMYLLDEYEAHV